ncbi:DUF3187 domain-containing protein [Sulfurimonas paralvinellae]|uniref:DUF3187 domain-containing protein n=1 Tax=Sulfurimonas paralvinellae TaxID=317658 RepID=A0A7M1B7P0_9BACT|nr:DUF3187 domain-containing protein [Sulfurimonas paralvinellae]QOP44798.1 DUF3187 domain-containing protein [Sulfurimonas paralvinellae]
MKKIITFMLLGSLSTALLAYSDMDMDGVDDSVDKCPNTPLTDLVDINGCTKKVIKVSKTTAATAHFDIVVGANYAGSNFVTTPATDTYSTSLQLDYYYKDFSLQASTSYYTTDSDGYNENGMNDSFVGGAYNFHPLKALTLRVGMGALLPTYDTSLNNNNTDYVGSLNASYMFGKANIFGGYVFTKVNDDDVVLSLHGGAQTQNILYKDTNAYSAGLGYYLTNKLYVSGAYNQTESIYKSVEDAKTVSGYAYYSIDKNWFMNLSYAYGLSDSASDHAASIKLGYYF